MEAPRKKMHKLYLGAAILGAGEPEPLLPRETEDLPEETDETEERGVLFLLDMTLQIQITI